MELVRRFRDDGDMLVREKVPPAEYTKHMLEAKFCPICGGCSRRRLTLALRLALTLALALALALTPNP